jgi:hypothetical protein
MQKEADYQHESVTDVSGSFVTDVPVQTERPPVEKLGVRQHFVTEQAAWR